MNPAKIVAISALTWQLSRRGRQSATALYRKFSKDSSLACDSALAAASIATRS